MTNEEKGGIIKPSNNVLKINYEGEERDMADKENNFGPSPQIHLYQTSKKLLEFTNKMIVADVSNYGNVHSQGGGGNIPSRIGLQLQDYSAGTGDANVKLFANVSPSEIAYLYSLAKRGEKEINFVQQKIIAAKKGNDGRAPVTKLEIIRAEKDRNGNERKLKWFIRITNGSGVPEESTTGGIQCKPGSFTKEKEAYINLSDEDMFKALHEVNTFVELWQIANALPVIKAAQQRINEFHQNRSA